ncbi:MAG TPA: O-antigen ligase family protein, partial [bacterium]|nr:O-antigen ligase family protein [bacterium]
MAASLKFPSTWRGRLIALLFLGTLAACLFIPATPAPIRFGMDLAVAWSVLAFCLLLMSSPAASAQEAPALRLDFLDLLVLLSIGWVLLSAWNSSEIFESFASFKNFLALGLWWLCLRRAWKKVPELYPLFEKGIRLAALPLSAWILAGLALNRFEPFAGPFPNVNFTALFLGFALILWATEWLHGNSSRSASALLFIFAAWGGTQSRGAFLALSATLVFYLLIHYGAVEARLRRFKTRQWLFFAAAAFFMLICSALMIERLLGGDRIDPRSSGRIQVWISAFHMACDQPLFG